MKLRAVSILTVLTAAAGGASGCAQPAVQVANLDGDQAALEQCEMVTGSRIRPRDTADCEAIGYALKRYTAEQIQATGEADLYDALRMLDPAFQ